MQKTAGIKQEKLLILLEEMGARTRPTVAAAYLQTVALLNRAPTRT